MFSKAFSRLTKPKKDDPGNQPEATFSLTLPGYKLSKMMKASGRIALSVLQQVVSEHDRTAFASFMPQPALAGSAIHAGNILNQDGLSSNQMNRTQLFEPSSGLSGPAAASESLKHAIYPLIKGEYATTPRGTFSIGRVEGNDMIMPDYAISKKHATIQADKGRFDITDCGSTNGTRVNNKPVGKKPITLHDRDVISFARYEFMFLYPETLYTMLRKEKS
jgi:FHA domain